MSEEAAASETDPPRALPFDPARVAHKMAFDTAAPKLEQMIEAIEEIIHEAVTCKIRAEDGNVANWKRIAFAERGVDWMRRFVPFKGKTAAFLREMERCQ